MLVLQFYLYPIYDYVAMFSCVSADDVHDSVPYLTPMATALREFDSDVQNDSDDDQLVEDYDRTASGNHVLALLLRFMSSR